MAKPIDEIEHRRILKLLAEGHTLGEVARTTGRSRATIHRIAHETGHTFDRSATKRATEAKKVDTAARRLELGQVAQEEALELLRGIRAPSVLHHWDSRLGEWATLELAGPLGRDMRDRAVAFGIVADKALRLLDVDTTQDGIDAVSRWLKWVTGEAASPHGEAS